MKILNIIQNRAVTLEGYVTRDYYYNIIVPEMGEHFTYVEMKNKNKDELFLILVQSKALISEKLFMEKALKLKGDSLICKAVYNEYKELLLQFYAKLGSFYIYTVPTIMDLFYFHRSYFHALYDYVGEKTQFDVSSLFSLFRKLLPIELVNIIQCLKYITAYPLAKYLKNELPNKPSGFPLGSSLGFEGGVRIFLKNRINSADRNNNKKTNKKLHSSAYQYSLVLNVLANRLILFL